MKSWIVQNDTNARRVNSLGNHTVNTSYNFWVVFVDFDREDFRLRTSNHVYRIRLALPHFPCVVKFVGGQSLPGEIVDLLFKMTSKSILPAGSWEVNVKHVMYNHVLSIILESKSTISPRILCPPTNFTTHEKCGRASRIR